MIRILRLFFFSILFFAVTPLYGQTVDIARQVILPKYCVGDILELRADKYLTSVERSKATYLWNDGSTKNKIYVSGPGTYSVTVTISGVRYSSSATVSYVQDLSVDLGRDTVFCDGVTTSWTLDGTRGLSSTAGVSFTWYENELGTKRLVSHSQTYRASKPATYELITTKSGCSNTETINIEFGSKMTVDLGINRLGDNRLCHGSTLDLDAGSKLTSAQRAGATYLWSDGSTGRTLRVSAPGNYGVTVSSKGCTISDDIDIDYVPEIQLSLPATKTLCPGGSSTIKVSSVLTTTLPSSKYTTVWGRRVPGMVLGTSALLDIAVNQKEYNIKSSETYYLFAFPLGSASNISAFDKCTIIDSVQVNAPSAASTFLVNLGADDNSVCYGEVVTLDAGKSLTPPQKAVASYLWSDGSTKETLKVSKSGKYSVAVTKAGGCTFLDTVELGYLPQVQLDLRDTLLCFGATHRLDAGRLLSAAQLSGATYLWSDGSTGRTLDVSRAGTYSVDVTVNGCTVSDLVTVRYKPKVDVDLGRDTLLCFGATHRLDAGRLLSASQLLGATYLWSDGSTGRTLDVSRAGTYGGGAKVNGCLTSGVITVSYKPKVDVDLGRDTLLCFGATHRLDAGRLLSAVQLSGATYLWSDGSTGRTLDVSSAGTYSVNVRVGGCTVSDALTVSYKLKVPIDLGRDTLLCLGQRYRLDAGRLLSISQLSGATYLWSDGSTNRMLDVSRAGTYSVRVTVGGCTVSDAVKVSYKPKIDVDLGRDTLLCFGAVHRLDGGRLLSASQLLGATYLWSDGSTSRTLDVSSAGTYSVDVTVDGCRVSDAIVVDYVPELKVSLGGDTTLCYGEVLPLRGGKDMLGRVGLKYAWSKDGVVLSGETREGYDVSSAGDYAVRVTDRVCSKSDAIKVSYKPKIDLNLGRDTLLCFGATHRLDASRLLSAAQLLGATYLWSDGSTNRELDVSGSGTYSVDVTVDGCRVSDAIVVDYVPELKVSLGGDTTLCYGEVLPLRGGKDMLGRVGLKYAWSKDGVVLSGETREGYDVSSAGDYAVRVTDRVCSKSDAIKVSYKPKIDLNLGRDTLLCFGATHRLDASRLLSAAQLLGATYLWSDGSTNRELDVSGSGTYSVDVTVDGCRVSDAIVVDYVPELKVNLGGDTTLCYGEVLPLRGGKDMLGRVGLKYAWSKDGVVLSGETREGYDVSSSGDYAVKVTDRVCSKSDAIKVSYKPKIDVNLGRDTLLCFGAVHRLDGGRFLSAAQLLGASYLWSDGSTNRELDVSSAGTYSVDVTVDGCRVSDAIVVDYVPELKVNLGGDTTLCYGEVLPLRGGKDMLGRVGLKYAWSKDGVVLSGETREGYDVSAAGDYAVKVTDRVCFKSDAIKVSYKPKIDVDLGRDTLLCFGAVHRLDGGRLLSASQLLGATYLWSDGSTSRTLDVSSAGTYSVDVTVDGCRVSDAIVVDYVPELKVSLGGDTTLCYGEVLPLRGGKDMLGRVGLKYAWSKDGVVLSGETREGYDVSSAGDYAVRVTDRVCSKSDAIKVSYKPKIDLNLGRDTLLCFGATHRLDASRLLSAAQLLGATYLWSDGSTNRELDVSGSGTYSVDVTVDGCRVSDAIVVDYVPELKVNLGGDTTLCYGEVLPLRGGKDMLGRVGLKYAWSKDGVVLSGETREGYDVSSSGDYAVKVTDRVCSKSDAIKVSYKPKIDVNLGRDTLLCFGATHRLDGGRLLSASQLLGASYLWSDGSTNRELDVSSAGTYSVEVTVDGCRVSDAIVVDYVPELKVDLGGDTTLCYGVKLPLRGGKDMLGRVGLKYAWSKDGVVLSGETREGYDVSSSGDYAVRVTDRVCSKSDAIKVSYKPKIDVDLGRDTLLCFGEVYRLDGGRLLSAAQLLGASYLWSDGSTNRELDVSSAGTYSVNVTVDGCSVSDKVNVATAPNLNQKLQIDTVCAGGVIKVDLSSAFPSHFRSKIKYLWEDGSTAAVRTFNSSFKSKVKLSFGHCTAENVIDVNFYPLPKIPTRDTSFCYTYPKVKLDAGDFESYLWSTGAKTRFIEVSEGIYTVKLRYKVSPNRYCTYQSKVDVQRNLGPDFEVSLKGNKLEVLPFGFAYAPYQYSLDGKTYQSKTKYDLPIGTHYIWVRDRMGCVSKSAPFDVLAFPIPKFFTPNGDGINDIWEFGRFDQYPAARVFIYNRYGVLMYEYSAGKTGWDGTLGGVPLPPNDYWYVIDLGNGKVMKGHFTLLRE